MEIENKKSYHSAHKNSRKKCERGIQDIKGHNRKECGNDKCYGRCKSVKSIGEINGIYHSNHKKHRKDIVDKAKLKLNCGKGYVKRSIKISRKCKRTHVDYCHQKFKCKLLLDGKSLVLLFDKLAVIVKEAKQVLQVLLEEKIFSHL